MYAVCIILYTVSILNMGGVSRKARSSTRGRVHNMRRRKRGGTKSILVKEKRGERSTKKVTWSESIPAPKPKLGRTRSRTKAANSEASR